MNSEIEEEIYNGFHFL